MYICVCYIILFPQTPSYIYVSSKCLFFTLLKTDAPRIHLCVFKMFVFYFAKN